MIEQEWLLREIIDFLLLIYDCKMETTHANDRLLYSQDLCYVTGWIKKLYQTSDPELVANEILGSQTDKHFDYWRQGVWGERESNGLAALRLSIHKKLGD